MGDIDRIWEYIIAVLLAMAGGFAKLLSVKNSRKMKLKRILSELFISGFSGLMVLLFARATGLSGDWVGVVCGMSGWTSPRILDFVTKATAKKIGIDTDGHKDTKE